MATLPVPIPDQHVPKAVQAAAFQMTGTPFSPAVDAIVAKVVAGQATTAAEKTQLGVAFCQWQLHDAWLDLLAQDAVTATRSDPANKWS